MCKYNILGVDIELVQRKIFKLAIEFDRICRKYNINYSLSYGSLLGGVRHHGFIPWDDDFDVMMLRKDYKKFLKVANKELNPSKFLLETNKSNKNYHLSFAKLRLLSSEFVETAVSKLNICHSLYIDIFPIDNAYKRTVILQSKLASLFVGARRIKLGFENTNKIAKLLSHFPMNFINSCNEFFMRINNSLPCKNTYLFCMGGPLSKLFHKKMFKKYIDIEFMGCKLMAIEDYDTWLTTVYGDYMTPPPVDKRNPKHLVEKIKI